MTYVEIRKIRLPSGLDIIGQIKIMQSSLQSHNPLWTKIDTCLKTLLVCLHSIPTQKELTTSSFIPQIQIV